MSKKCRHPKCDAFARKLTGTEITSLGGFNLTHEVCKRIFLGTVQGFCPFHAAKNLTGDLRPENSILDVIKRKWNYYVQDNFADAKGYALCSICSTSLAADRGKHPVSLIEDTLSALSVPKKRIETIVWLQTGASGGLGTCFDCTLITQTAFEYDAIGNLVETELDRMCQANLA